MSPWNWKFTLLLALFLYASYAVVFRESERCPLLLAKTRTGWTVFVEAPAAPGRISPLEAKWICGDGRLSRAIHPFLQVPSPLLTR